MAEVNFQVRLERTKLASKLALWRLRTCFAKPRKCLDISQNSNHARHVSYPSGAGFKHVGHPLGIYCFKISSQIKSSVKGTQMSLTHGYDSFWSSCWAIRHSNWSHPALLQNKILPDTHEQLKNMAFAFDFRSQRELRFLIRGADLTKWTQWIFMQLFQLAIMIRYDCDKKHTYAIDSLIHHSEDEGNRNVKAVARDDENTYFYI